MKSLLTVFILIFSLESFATTFGSFSCGEIVEFVDKEIENLQEKIANRLGYTLKDHRLELFGVPIKRVKND